MIPDEGGAMTTTETLLDGLTEERLLDHVRILASDEFEGRRPGTRGEQKTVAYLTGLCAAWGLTGLGPGGSFVQEVPALAHVARSTMRIGFVDGSTAGPEQIDDYVIRSSLAHVDLDTEIVFAGYGIVAPEYGWDDYAGIDVTGKIVIVLAGDPSRPDPADPGRPDPAFFRGAAMTFHGRWTTKYDVAGARGAAGCFIIHDEQRSGYPFSVQQGSWGGEQVVAEPAAGRLPVEGWLTGALGHDIIARGGAEVADLEARAARPGFRAVPLAARAAISVENDVRRFSSQNIVAAIPGADLADEYVVLSAHWDHIGQKIEDGEVVGTYSGAVDNATGVSSILEMTRAFALSPARRTIVVLLSTLEESGLLGAAHYAQNPPVPLESTVAVVNLDMMNVWGRTSDIVSIGAGHSDLDDVLERHAAAQSRAVVDDPEPEKGYFYRSDHLEFLKLGVPALFFLHPGSTYRDKPADFGARRRHRYVSEQYHTLADKVEDDWDLAGMVEDTRLLTHVARDIADSDTRPRWSPTSEFAPR